MRLDWAKADLYASLIWQLCFSLSFCGQGEGKAKKVQVFPGHLLALEHAVQQDYFPQDHASLLLTFVSRYKSRLCLDTIVMS